MYDKLMKWSAIFGTLFFTLITAVMLYYSAVKPLVYVQATEPQTQSSTVSAETQLQILVPEERSSSTAFYIPVGNQTARDQIRIENDYNGHRLSIYVKGMDTSFYDTAELYGRLEEIEQVQIGSTADGIRILLQLDRLYEYEAVLESQKLCLTFQRPSERYDTIVVLDAGHGGSDNGIVSGSIYESSYCFDMASRVQSLLEQDGIKVYLTRYAEESVSVEQRAYLATEAEADLFVSLHLSAGLEYGIFAYYNADYFTPVLTNAELASQLVTETASAVNNRGRIAPLELSVQEEAGEISHEEQVLSLLQVPGIYLTLGCVENSREAQLLVREDYQQQLAEGIYQGIINSLEQIQQ